MYHFCAAWTENIAVRLHLLFLLTLDEKQESFLKFDMLPNTFWMILDDSCQILHA